MSKLLLLTNARIIDMSHWLVNVSIKGLAKFKVLRRVWFPFQAAAMRQVYNDS